MYPKSGNGYTFFICTQNSPKRVHNNEVVDGGKTQYDNNIRWETIEYQIELESEIQEFFKTVLVEIQTRILKKLEDMFGEDIE